jgi:uncharacterized membrane-anchored protein YitT (DUF2179 family)
MKSRENGAHPPDRFRDILIDALFFIAGTAVYSVSVSVFTAPNRIAPGGLTGVATILYYLIGTPIGIMIFVLNIPLFILGLRFIGGRFIVKTMICTALMSVFSDLTGCLPHFSGDRLLAALYGGVLSGAGLALVFMRGSTTGGTDIASRLIRLKYDQVPMGRLMMLLNFIIVVIAAVVFRSLENALYSIIVIFTSSRVIDSVLYGSDTGRMVMIVSSKEEEVAKAIQQDVHRGVTLLKGTGFYTGKAHNVLLCAVRRPEAARVRTVVRRTDPSAFMIVCTAQEVIGEGFKPISNDD